MEKKSELYEILLEREFISRCTDPERLNALFLEEEVTGYIGFDPTAPSLHVGSLIQIMALKWMEKTGHRPLVLLGGGTTRIGDPSGKNEPRELIQIQQIEKNTESIRKIFQKILDPEILLETNNLKWLVTENLLYFLREYGRHFPIRTLLNYENVKTRLENEKSGFSLMEFCYPILQAYDFLELAKRHNCKLQIGGSDQWGNICAGIDLARRAENLSLYGITTQLITGNGGKKMGKTVEGAIWLDPELCSAYDFWQYWRNTPDHQIGRFLKLFTFLPLEEIRRLQNLSGQELNEAKEILANEVTSIVHSQEEAEKASQTAKNTFEKGMLDSGLPETILSIEEIDSGFSLAQSLVKTDLVASKNQAKRLISEGAVRINDTVEKNPSRAFTKEDFTEYSLRITVGRKKNVIITIQPE